MANTYGIYKEQLRDDLQAEIEANTAAASTIPTGDANALAAANTYSDGLITQLKGGVGVTYDTLKKLADELIAVKAIIGDSSPDADNIIDTVTELMAVLSNYPEGTDLFLLIQGKVDKTDVHNALDCVVSGKVADARQLKVLNDFIVAMGTSVKGDKITPSTTPSGTGVAAWLIAEAGTYIGGNVLPANSLGFLLRNASNVYSVTYTALDFSQFQRKIEARLKADLEVGKNIFDKDQITTGAYTHINGAIVADSNYFFTEPMAVIAGQQYVSNKQVAYRCYFDKSQNVVSGGGYNVTTFTPPSTTAYVVCSFANSNLSGLQIEKGATATSYENFSLKVKNNQLNLSNYQNLSKKDSFSISKEKISTAIFENILGFTNANEGVTGVTGANSMALNIPIINTDKDFRFDVIFTTNAVSAGSSLKLNIKNKANSFYGDIHFTMYQNSAISQMATYAMSVGSIPVGSKLQFSVIGHKGRVTQSLSVVNGWNGEFGSGYQSPLTNKIFHGIKENTSVFNSIQPIKDLDFIEITATNGNEYVINSINLSAGTYDSDFDLNTICALKVLNDSLDEAYLPMLYSFKGAKTLAQWHHPNGYQGNVYNADLFSKLYNNGVAICFGTFNSYNNPAGTALYGAGVTSSNWGAPSGLKYRKRLMDISKKIIKPNNLVSIGGSMGGLNALAYSIAYPDDVNCIVSVSGALDLIANFNNGSFNNIIKKAYASAYICIEANTGVAVTDPLKWTKIANEKTSPVTNYFENNKFYDTYSASKSYVIGDVVFVDYTGVASGLNSFSPMYNGLKLATIPILLIHGSSDTLITPSQSTNFKTYIEGIGGSKIEFISAVGEGHLSPGCFKNNEIIEFIHKYI